jgi:hypothetical protein
MRIRWQFNDLKNIISNIFFIHSLCNYLTCTSYVKKEKNANYKAHINYQSTITSVRFMWLYKLDFLYNKRSAFIFIFLVQHFFYHKK